MSDTRMLSYEIDALAADRFKASWERMVLLAAIKRAEYEDRELPEPILFAVNEHWLLSLRDVLPQPSIITWPRIASERRWVLSPPTGAEGKTE